LLQSEASQRLELAPVLQQGDIVVTDKNRANLAMRLCQFATVADRKKKLQVAKEHRAP
jgi:hypothetical protein